MLKTAHKKTGYEIKISRNSINSSIRRQNRPISKWLHHVKRNTDYSFSVSWKEKINKKTKIEKTQM